jgi:tetrahydromethanopterin S-methyltransferase subunit C
MNTFIDTYFKIPLLVRYTFITAINSLLAYLFYVSLFFGMYYKNHYYLAVFANFFIIASFSYCTMKLFVFNTKYAPLPEYLKTLAVFAGAFLINILLITFLSGLLGINIKAAGFICLVLVFVLTYMGLKNYAFNHRVDYFYRPLKSR